MAPERPTPREPLTSSSGFITFSPQSPAMLTAPRTRTGPYPPPGRLSPEIGSHAWVFWLAYNTFSPPKAVLPYRELEGAIFVLAVQENINGHRPMKLPLPGTIRHSCPEAIVVSFVAEAGDNFPWAKIHIYPSSPCSLEHCHRVSPCTNHLRLTLALG